MAQPQLLQGSWEELSAYAHEFAGRADLLLIIPGDVEAKSDPPGAGTNLAEALKEKMGLVNFTPSDLSEDTGWKFAARLHERRQKEQP